jgi:hypothetical protein
MDHFGYIPDNDQPKVPSLQPQTELDRNWLLSRIEMILAGYRKADYHNLEAFLTQAAIILAKFPQDIIEFVSAPETGIQTRLQWPPSLAEILDACTAEQTQREEVARYSRRLAEMLPPPTPPPPAPRLPKPKFSAAQSYEIMVAKYGRPFGPFEHGREHPYGK